MKKLAYLSLGSNLGDRRSNLEEALRRLNGIGDVKAISSFFETAPVDFTRQPEFLNIAVIFETDKMPRQLLHALMEIERVLGRKRAAAKGSVKGPRPIDIDILLFGSSIVETPELTIPHPRMHQRRFVLEPLVEIAPEVRHPVLKRTMRELCEALPAGSDWVRRMPAQ
jgi:2-amino-4-hydroxy-6-hydroxymethyldihydropteridine diphosphokinase